MSVKLDSLKVISWNTNSVRNKKEELAYGLSAHNIDVILIQETFLKPSIILYSVYQRYGEPLVPADYSKLFNTDAAIILGSDFNAQNTRWGCRTTNNRGSTLSTLCDPHTRAIASSVLHELDSVLLELGDGRLLGAPFKLSYKVTN